MLHHDIRASLLYSYENCMHEWQLDPARNRRNRTPGWSSAANAFNHCQATVQIALLVDGVAVGKLLSVSC